MFTTDLEFEDEVRRIARLLWPIAEFDGAAIEDGRERDGIFETDEFVHVIECTTSRNKSKAQQDAGKIAKLIRKLVVRYPAKFIKGWFITQEEPTADQRGVVREISKKDRLQIVALSFDQFRSKLVDGRTYLTQRKTYPFGSVRDPSSGNALFEMKYIPMEILDEQGRTYGTDEIADGLLSGDSFVIVGDYGAGKSSTLRQIFLELATRFWTNKTLTFPVLLNLRDHHGQTEPVEALERHARRVGFASPSSLVRAWRAGFVILLLDGFDEIAAAGWAGKTRTLKDLRYRSMELIRAFLRESPRNMGFVVAGRAHFFDNANEMTKALNLRTGIKVLHLDEFREHQVAEFLESLGWHEIIPEWLPSRPLLLAYLASRDLLPPVLNVGLESDPASGWDSLLEKIANREAELEAGIDPDTVRRLIEHLSMLARESVDGFGPLSPDVIISAFHSVCGYPPDDRGAVLLQRLPGLGAHHSEDGARVFIDRDFTDAARGGAIFRVIENPYDFTFDCENWQSAINPLAAQVAAYRSEQARFGSGKIIAAMRQLVDRHRAYTVGADLVLVMLENCYSCDEQIFLREVIIPELTFDQPECNLGPIEFQDSVVGKLTILSDFPEYAVPKFRQTHFGQVEGRVGAHDLPPSHFIGCTFDAFESPARTTNAIMNLALPLPTKVLLTVLKKLYAQGGAGRREAAFYRGLDLRAQALVKDVLNLLRRENFAVRSMRGTHEIWLPTRVGESRRRALAMLAAPNATADALIDVSREIN